MSKLSKFSKAVSAFLVSIATGLIVGGIIVGKDAIVLSIIIASLTTAGVVAAPANKP